MIYEVPKPDEPIRQGDIFRYIPRIEFDLGKLPVMEGKEILSKDWINVSKINPITMIVAARPVEAIVINQNCDVVRTDDIALCEISTIDKVVPLSKDTKTPRSWERLITKHSRENLKWFYLPIDDDIFKEKMAVDFRSVLHASRVYLEKNLEQLRIGRLNKIATEHFRERLSEYFRRYPYDEWYPLDKSEFEEYRKDKGDTKPFPYQV
ncbi:MAG: hypothetical protein ABSA23_02710 [Anaerolineales bacterium]|jgi:hypothetical protein